MGRLPTFYQGQAELLSTVRRAHLPRGFILPRPASSSEFLRSSSRPSWLGLYLIRVLKPSSRRTETVHMFARASDPCFVPSPGFLDLSTVFSAFGLAGLSRPAATSRVLCCSARETISQPLDTAQCSIRRATSTPGRGLASISSPFRKIREEPLDRAWAGPRSACVNSRVLTQGLRDPRSSRPGGNSAARTPSASLRSFRPPPLRTRTPPRP